MVIKSSKVAYKRHYPKEEPLLAQTKGLLRRFSLQARKGLGQHFLIDEEVLKLIVSAAGLTSADVIMEIGSGLGVLTRELVRQGGWVIAVELDSRLTAILQQSLASFKNITIVNEDILQVDQLTLLQEQKAKFPAGISCPFSYKVVANLPYYITSPVLRHFLEASLKPQVMVVMVQKEVAEAIVAKPGQMSMLSISVQFYGEAVIVSYVPARCFYPVPEVDSAILKIELYAQPLVEVTNREGFFRLVQAGFSAPRKQVGNSLAQGLGLSKADVLSLLGKASIMPQRRAETLTLDEWAKLGKVFTQVNEHVDSSSAS